MSSCGARSPLTLPRLRSSGSACRQGDGARRFWSTAIKTTGRSSSTCARIAADLDRPPAGNDVALPWDPEVSRLHAELERVRDDWVLCDDGLSRNGTFVNGARVSGRRRLCRGDILTVGETAIAYWSPDGASSASKTRTGGPTRRWRSRRPSAES